MAKSKYIIQCPLCSSVCMGYTHEETEVALKAHCYKNHPEAYAITQGYVEVDKG